MLYFRHKKLYYNTEEQQRWKTRILKDEAMSINAEEDFTFSSDSENSIEGKIESTVVEVPVNDYNCVLVYQ